MRHRPDRSGVDRGVEEVRRGHHTIHPIPDRAPVRLGEVELGAAGPEEHRVGKARVVMHVGEARQAQRKARANASAQRPHVALSGRVAALVVSFGVDHEAVHARPGDPGTDRRLREWAPSVDELPGADAQPASLERPHRCGGQLRPAVHSVPAFYHDELDPAPPRDRGDPGRITPARPRQVPDPHPVAVERTWPLRRRAGRGVRQQRPRADRRRQQRSDRKRDRPQPGTTAGSSSGHRGVASERARRPDPGNAPSGGRSQSPAHAGTLTAQSTRIAPPTWVAVRSCPPNASLRTNPRASNRASPARASRAGIPA